MYLIIWEYEVNAEKRSEFEKIYAITGEWVDLFKRAEGYLGTELLRDATDTQHYITIDRWTTRESYENFLIRWKEEYKILDEHCKGFTSREILIGKWITI